MVSKYVLSGQMKVRDIPDETDVLLVEDYDGTTLDLAASNCEKITSIYCQGNKLTSIILFSSVSELDCSNNQLTQLIGLTIRMRRLNCSNNQLLSLDISMCCLLSYVYCQSNKLTALYIRSAWIERVQCADNKLRELKIEDTSARFDYLNCTNNNLRSLDIQGLEPRNLLCDTGVTFEVEKSLMDKFVGVFTNMFD